MLYKRVEDLAIGNCIYNVYHPKTGILLLTPNYKLDANNLKQVQETFVDLEVDGVWIYTPGLEVLETFYSKELDESKRVFYSTLKCGFMTADKNVCLRKGVDVLTQAEAIRSLALGLESTPYRNAFMEPSLRFGEGEEWQRMASLRCYTALAMALEMRIWFSNELRARLQEYRLDDARVNYCALGLGSLLVDVNETFKSEHAKKIMDQLEGWPVARGIIKQRWQRWDGTGKGSEQDRGPKKGKEISPYTRLVKLMDVYSMKHVTEKKVPVRALYELKTQAGELKGLLDPECLKEFLKVMQPFAVGHEVTLNTDETAAVIAFNNRGRPCKPLVKILRKGKKSVKPFDVNLDSDKRFIVRYENYREDCSKYYYEL